MTGLARGMARPLGKGQLLARLGLLRRLMTRRARGFFLPHVHLVEGLGRDVGIKLGDRNLLLTGHRRTLHQPPEEKTGEHERRQEDDTPGSISAP